MVIPKTGIGNLVRKREKKTARVYQTGRSTLWASRHPGPSLCGRASGHVYFGCPAEVGKGSRLFHTHGRGTDGRPSPSGLILMSTVSDPGPRYVNRFIGSRVHCTTPGDGDRSCTKCSVIRRPLCVPTVKPGGIFSGVWASARLPCFCPVFSRPRDNPARPNRIAHLQAVPVRSAPIQWHPECLRNRLSPHGETDLTHAHN